MKKYLLILFLPLIAYGSNEIRSFNAGATTCFAVIREVDGDVWYPVGEVFEAWGTGARTAADYDIALVDKTGGFFVGDFDTNISAGYYYIISHQQEAGAPADTDPATWQEYGYWDGTSWISIADITSKLPTNYIMGSSDVDDHDTAIEMSMFADGTVWVDPTGTDSTAWPYGTAPYPTSTIANGKTIADALNIQHINITGVIVLSEALEGYDLTGSGNIDYSNLLFINGQSIEHSTLRNLVVTGATGNSALIADQSRYTDCLLIDHTNINGVIQGGSIGGDCSVLDTAYALFIDSFFGQGSACTLTLQAPAVCNIINMRGSLTLSGMDGGACNVTLTDGSFITIDNTCTAGTITLTGIGTVTDNSGAGCTVVALADTPTVLHAATNTLIADANTNIIAEVNDIEVDNDAIAAAVWDYICEGTYTYQDFVRIMAAALFGTSSGGGTTNPKFYSPADDSKVRIDATVNSNGNRTSMILDPE